MSDVSAAGADGGRSRSRRGRLAALTVASAALLLTSAGQATSVPAPAEPEPFLAEPDYQVHATGTVRVGFGEADITPDWPVRLSYGRSEPTAGFYDRALVHALLLEVGEIEALLLEFDVIGIRGGDAAFIKQEIARQTGLDPRHMIVAATHNHSYARTRDEQVRAFMTARAADAVREAQASLSDARIGVGKLNAREDLNLNRAELEGIANPLLYVLRVDDARGNLRGLLFNYGTHATIFTEWSDVGQTGPDWPGYVREYVKARTRLDLLYERYQNKNDISTDPFVMFAGGAAGDQQPRRSDIVLRGAPTPPKKVFMEKLGEEVLRLVERVETTGRVDLTFRSTAVELERRDGHQQEVLLQSLVLNDAVLATMPGELGVDLGYQFEAGSPFEKNMLITNADGYIGYIVPEHLALEQVTYQSKGVSFRPHYGVRLIDESLRLIRPEHPATPSLEPAELLGGISGTVDYDGDNVIAIGVRRIPAWPNYGGGFWGQRTVVGADGRWSLDRLAPGTFYVYVVEADPEAPAPTGNKTSYSDLRTLGYGYPVTVERGRETKNVHFDLPSDLLETAVTGLKLQPETLVVEDHTVSGRFTIGGKPAPDEIVHVGLYPADLTYRNLEQYLARPEIRTRAREDGRFRFESVPPGRYRVVAILDVNRNDLVERRGIDVLSRVGDSPVLHVPGDPTRSVP